MGGILQSQFDSSRHRVRSAAGDRVMKLGLQKRTPGMTENRPPVSAPKSQRQSCERLGYSGERQLRQCMPPFQWCTGAMDTL
jgi:hypothetical protein